MTLFEEIVYESTILNELKQGSNDEEIFTAIKSMKRVRITYDDKKPRESWRGTKGKRQRNILPIVYGITKSGKPAVGAYQTYGSTKRGIPKWKLFLLDNIYSWKNSTRTFKKRKDELVKLGLNTNGDKRFKEIFIISPLCDGYEGVERTSKPISDKPIDKEKIEPIVQQQSAEQPVKKKEDIKKQNVNRTTQQKTIDIKSQNTDIPSKMAAPETKPISKSEIEPQQTTTEVPENTPKTNLAATSRPITQQDVENTFDDTEVSKAKDLMNRMDNLYNEKNEEENEEQ